MSNLSIKTLLLFIPKRSINTPLYSLSNHITHSSIVFATCDTQCHDFGTYPCHETSSFCVEDLKDSFGLLKDYRNGGDDDDGVKFGTRGVARIIGEGGRKDETLGEGSSFCVEYIEDSFRLLKECRNGDDIHGSLSFETRGVAKTLGEWGREAEPLGGGSKRQDLRGIGKSKSVEFQKLRGTMIAFRQADNFETYPCHETSSFCVEYIKDSCGLSKESINGDDDDYKFRFRTRGVARNLGEGGGKDMALGGGLRRQDFRRIGNPTSMNFYKLRGPMMTFGQAVALYSTEADNSDTNPNPESSAFCIEYLTNSCGLSKESAVSISNCVKLYEKNKEHYDSVLSFLKNNHFTDAHITKLIEKCPSVLYNRISANLEPKIQFFIEIGISSSYVPEILVTNPFILSRSLESQLRPSMTLLREYLSDPEKLYLAIRRGPWILTSDWKEHGRKLEYLIELGVKKNRLQDFIVLQPRCLYQSVERIKYAVDMVKSMGISPQETRFITLLRVVLSLSESSWKEKVKIFESMGWSKDEVKSTFAKNPHCLSCSEKKLRLAMDYFVNTVKVDRGTIIGYPKVLMYSIEKRVIPRYTVWKILEEKNLIKGNFMWVLNMSEKDFMKQYVIKHSREIPNLRKIFQSSRKNAMRLA